MSKRSITNIARRQRGRRGPRERDVQAAILAWLRAVGVLVRRVPVGPVIQQRGGREVWAASPLRGFPDIAGVLRRRFPGVLFAVEVKRPGRGARVSADQASCLAALAAAGAKVCVATSVADVATFLVRLGEVDPRLGPPLTSGEADVKRRRATPRNTREVPSNESR